MSTTAIEFWFDLASPYSALAALRIAEVAAGLDVRWRPFLFPSKGRWTWRDVPRRAARRGMSFRQPSRFPRHSVLAGRVALVALGEAWGERTASGPPARGRGGLGAGGTGPGLSAPSAPRAPARERSTCAPRASAVGWCRRRSVRYDVRRSMRGPRTPAEKVIACAVGAVATWFLTIAVGFSPHRNLPRTFGQGVFEVVWLTFPGLVVGGFWAARGPAGRFPLFAAAVTAGALVWSAHGFDIQADPLAALTIVFAPLVVACIAAGAIGLTALAGWVRRRAGHSDASP